MSDLKPCPFCGNQDVEWQESYVGFSVECCRCDFHVGGDLTLHAAVQLWNTRQYNLPAELPDHVKQSVQAKMPLTLDKLWTAILEELNNGDD